MYNNRRFSYEVRSRVPRVQTVRRMSPIAVIFLMVFIVGACIGSGFLGAKIVGDKIKNSTPANENTTVIYREPQDRAEYVSSSGEVKTPQEVASLVSQSVVEIYTESAVQSKNSSCLGSGVVISESGHVLTAYHVIEDVDDVKVKLNDGASFTAEWVKGDKLSDLAVVKIHAETLNCADVGRSSKLSPGEQIVTVGNPYASLGNTVTVGNVSALDRDVTIGSKKLENLIQLACPMNHGDSGGGVFNLQGKLVGIVNARGVGDYGVNVGFASPIDDAINIAENIMTKGYVEGRVDISVLDLKEISNSPSTPAGLYFMKNNSDLYLPFKAQDYIVSLAGIPVSTLEEWEEVLASRQVGSVVEVKYRRDGIEGVIKMSVLQRKDCD